MQMLFDTEEFMVVHINGNDPGEEGPRPLLARHGFEIFNKRGNRSIYLDGYMARLFQQQINKWRENTPTQEEVEQVLDGYTQLATNLNPTELH